MGGIYCCLRTKSIANASRGRLCVKHGCLRNEMNPSRGTRKISAPCGTGPMVPCNKFLMCHHVKGDGGTIYGRDRGWHRRRGPTHTAPFPLRAAHVNREYTSHADRKVTYLPKASASRPPVPWRDGLAWIQRWETGQERLAPHGDRARGRPLNEKYPRRSNFPEGPNQVLGTKLNKEALKKKSHCRGLQQYSASQPAERRMIRGEHRSQEGGLGSSWI